MEDWGDDKNTGRFDTVEMIMTEILEKAIAEASKLPSDEQDRLGEWLLAELQADRVWAESFRNSADTLSSMAREALEEYRLGRTKELDPSDL